MKRLTFFSLIIVIASAIAIIFNSGTMDASSHREAPIISTDPLADNTDVYAFVSPEDTTKLNIIACYIPFEEPSGGPNFNKFGTDMIYEINIDNVGDRLAHVTYQFEFTTVTGNQNTFLYNTGDVTSLNDPDLNVKQTYTVKRIVNGVTVWTSPSLSVPPVYIGGPGHSDPAYAGPNSMSNYQALMSSAVQNLPSNGGKVFAGPTDDPFYVDLGAAFDLLKIRGGAPGDNVNGKDAVAGYNVHSLVIQVPFSDVTRNGNPNPSANDSNAIVGVWCTSSRRTTTVINPDGSRIATGPFVQVSRLGMPLVNEVVLPLSQKDRWNASQPVADAQFLSYVTNSELAGLLNALYPPLQDIPTTNRTDLVSVFLTGVPGLNQRPQDLITPSEQLRINLGINPVPVANENRLGVIAGDNAGFPNGRRLRDDVVDISLRVVGGVLLGGPYINGLNDKLGDNVKENDKPFQTVFPYLAAPHDGYTNSHGKVYSGTIGIGPTGGNIPKSPSLGQNYPNPFNPSTQLKYQLTKTQNVTIRVFDLLGKEVRVLVNEQLNAGEYTALWDGRNNSGSLVASGTYFYRLETEDFVDAKKMILLK